MKSKTIMDLITNEYYGYNEYVKLAKEEINPTFQAALTKIAKEKLENIKDLKTIHPEVVQEIEDKINYYTQLKTML